MIQRLNLCVSLTVIVAERWRREKRFVIERMRSRLHKSSNDLMDVEQSVNKHLKEQFDILGKKSCRASIIHKKCRLIFGGL